MRCTPWQIPTRGSWIGLLDAGPGFTISASQASAMDQSPSELTVSSGGALVGFACDKLAAVSPSAREKSSKASSVVYVADPELMFRCSCCSGLTVGIGRPRGGCPSCARPTRLGDSVRCTPRAHDKKTRVNRYTSTLCGKKPAGRYRGTSMRFTCPAGMQACVCMLLLPLE